jgi:hypothetical protein
VSKNGKDLGRQNTQIEANDNEEQPKSRIEQRETVNRTREIKTSADQLASSPETSLCMWNPWRQDVIAGPPPLPPAPLLARRADGRCHAGGRC